MKLFVISDIHGMYKPFEQLLQHWHPQDKLVILGDLIDRGPQSLEVIRKVMALKETYGEQVVFCKGNHEQLLLDFIRSPQVSYPMYIRNGGRQTLRSFLKEAPKEVKELNPIAQAKYVKEHFAKELAFLESGELYTIIGNVLFTHAGFESYYADLSESTDDDFLWIREHYRQPNQTPYINVFGHTPTYQIHRDDNIWVSEDQKYIAIDGGCAFSGQLNGVLLNEQGKILDTFSEKEALANDGHS